MEQCNILDYFRGSPLQSTLPMTLLWKFGHTKHYHELLNKRKLIDTEINVILEHLD